MVSNTEINARLAFWREALSALRKAYLALLDGGVKSYTLKDRELTMLDRCPNDGQRIAWRQVGLTSA